MLKKEDNEERRIKSIKQKALKRKNVEAYFKEYSSTHCKWLQELTKAYKERGIFNTTPLILSDYYKTYEDKQIALLIGGLLLKNNNRIMEQVFGVKKILGHHPYKDLYENRRFVQLSNSVNQNKQIAYVGSTRYWQISRLLAILWNIEHTSSKNLYECFMTNIQEKMYTPYYALFVLFKDLPILDPKYRVNLTLMGFCGGGDVNTRLWQIRGLERKLLCPEYRELKIILETLLPKWNVCFTLKEVGELFGLENTIDLYYCVLAYKELAKYRRHEITRYINTFNRLYKSGLVGADVKRILTPLLPTIKFERESHII